MSKYYKPEETPDQASVRVEAWIERKEEVNAISKYYAGVYVVRHRLASG